MSDLEQRLLSRLTDPAEVSLIWEAGIRKEIFEEPICAAVFSFTIDYWRTEHRSKAPTLWVLEHEFPGLRLLTDVEESTLWLAEALQRKFAAIKLQEMLTAAAIASLDDPVATLRKLYGEAYEAAESVTPRATRSDMAANIDERRERYGRREERPEGIGLPFGIPELDEHTGGTMPGELALVGAFSKVGKSFLLCWCAVALHKAGFKPILFTLEMSRKEMEDRIDAMYAGVSYNRLTHGRLTMSEMKALHAAQEVLRERGELLVESPEEGDRTVANMINRARQVGADFVLIDQLSCMDPPYLTHTLKEHSSSIMKALKNEIGRSGREIPCLLAVQLNRDSLSEGASLKSFANATEIEQNCDIAIGLERSGEERRNHVMKCHILGARRSDSKSWLLAWELVDFTDIHVLQEIA